MLRLKIVVLALAITALTACHRQPSQRASAEHAEQCKVPRSQDSQASASNSVQPLAVSTPKHHHRRHHLQARRKDQNHRSVEQGS